MANSDITAERLRLLFSFDSDTGVFERKVSRQAFKLGTIAGSITKEGYVAIKIDDKSHKAHRLAWLYVHGSFPPDSIDHINGIRSDNRISNLRLADKKLNGENRKKQNTNNKIGLIGSSPCGNRWRSQICISGVVKYLGLFKTPEEAHQAYLTEKRKSHSGCTI